MLKVGPRLLESGDDSVKEIATILIISVKTPETHRANILLKPDLKPDLHSIADLVH
jgi:DNA-binding CsgD family transcriptional regulator